MSTPTPVSTPATIPSPATVSGAAAGRSGRPALTRQPPAETAALRASLADSAAQTMALREALAELRLQLDATPSAPPSELKGSTWHPSRPRVRLLLAAGLVGLLVITLAVLLITTRGSTGSQGQVVGPTTGSGPSAAASGPGTASPSGATSSSGPTVKPLPWPGGAVLVPAGLPASGPGIDSAGSDVTYAQDPDRVHLDAFERVVLASPGSTLVSLTPGLRTMLKGGVATTRLVVSDLQVEVNGQLVTPTPVSAGANPSSWTVVIPQSQAAARVVLRYRVAGAFVHEVPSPPGRVLVVLTPLSGTSSLQAQAPVTVRYLGAGVNGMSCPAAPLALGVCGQHMASWWVATVSAGSPIVVVQATLR